MSVLILAEIGSSHDGSVGQALALAHSVQEAGGTAIKTQDHRWQAVPEHAEHPRWMAHANGRHAGHALESRAAYVRRLEWADAGWLDFVACVRRIGMRHIVSPFSTDALRWHLVHATIDGIKIASGQVTNRPLLELARESGLPVFISSGMTTVTEDEAAHDLLQGADVTPMLCTSAYPCPPELVSFARKPLRGKWGYSDHTLGVAASLAAITLGATVIERHVGYDRRAYGSDARHSLTLDEFAAFVREARDLEQMLAGGVTKDEMAERLKETRRDFLYGNEEKRQACAGISRLESNDPTVPQPER